MNHNNMRLKVQLIIVLNIRTSMIQRAQISKLTYTARHSFVHSVKWKCEDYRICRISFRPFLSNCLKIITNRSSILLLVYCY